MNCRFYSTFTFNVLPWSYSSRPHNHTTRNVWTIIQQNAVLGHLWKLKQRYRLGQYFSKIRCKVHRVLSILNYFVSLCYLLVTDALTICILSRFLINLSVYDRSLASKADKISLASTRVICTLLRSSG